RDRRSWRGRSAADRRIGTEGRRTAPQRAPPTRGPGRDRSGRLGPGGGGRRRSRRRRRRRYGAGSRAWSEPHDLQQDLRPVLVSGRGAGGGTGAALGAPQAGEPGAVDEDAVVGI